MRVPVLLGLGLLGAAVGDGEAGEVRVRQLLDNPSAFDGRPITLEGTLRRLDAHVTRRGTRHYTFELSQDGRDVLIAVHGRPPCGAGAPVRVEGRFDAYRKRIDAAAVTCDVTSGALWSAPP